jgi:hypothetical protein
LSGTLRTVESNAVVGNVPLPLKVVLFAPFASHQTPEVAQTWANDFASGALFSTPTLPRPTNEPGEAEPPRPNWAGYDQCKADAARDRTDARRDENIAYNGKIAKLKTQSGILMTAVSYAGLAGSAGAGGGAVCAGVGIVPGAVVGATAGFIYGAIIGSTSRDEEKRQLDIEHAANLAAIETAYQEDIATCREQFQIPAEHVD